MNMSYWGVKFTVEWDDEVNVRIAHVIGWPYDDDKLGEAVDWVERVCECQIVL